MFNPEDPLSGSWPKFTQEQKEKQMQSDHQFGWNCRNCNASNYSRMNLFGDAYECEKCGTVHIIEVEVGVTVKSVQTAKEYNNK